MTATTLINYSTRDFASKEDLELYLERQDAAFSPEVTKLFTDAGMLRRVVTRIWNKKHAFRVGICLLYTSPSPRDMRRSRMPSSA